MKEILRKIFTDNHFISVKLSNPVQKRDLDFWACYKENAINFYLVLLMEEEELAINSVINDVSTYFDAIKSLETGYDERMDKNLSMLVCLKVKDSAVSKIYEDVFEIEEDPYFFKKYVLVYNDQNVSELTKLFNDPSKDSNQVINEVVNNSELFLNYKEDIGSTSLYEMCSKLMIKIPIIKLENKVQDVTDLNLEIDEELSKQELLTLKNFILNSDIVNEELAEALGYFVGDDFAHG